MQLNLSELEKREVTTAEGKHVSVPYVGPVQVTFANRSCFVGALVLGDGVLLGSIPLEDMDLVINSRRQEITVNPESPNIPSAVVKSVVKSLVRGSVEGGLSRAGMDVRDWRPALPRRRVVTARRRRCSSRLRDGHGRFLHPRRQPAARPRCAGGHRGPDRVLLRAGVDGRAAGRAADTGAGRRDGRRARRRSGPSRSAHPAPLGQPDARGARRQPGAGRVPTGVCAGRARRASRSGEQRVQSARGPGHDPHGRPAAGGERPRPERDRTQRGRQRAGGERPRSAPAAGPTPPLAAPSASCC